MQVFNDYVNSIKNIWFIIFKSCLKEEQIIFKEFFKTNNRFSHALKISADTLYYLKPNLVTEEIMGETIVFSMIDLASLLLFHDINETYCQFWIKKYKKWKKRNQLYEPKLIGMWILKLIYYIEYEINNNYTTNSGNYSNE